MRNVIFVFVVLILIVPACSRYFVATTLRTSNLKAYPGPLKPKDAVGYLTCSSSEMDIAVIDGTSVNQLKEVAEFQGGFSYVELLPGDHAILVGGSTFYTSTRGFHPNLTVDVSSVMSSMRGTSELSFMVEAGHVYVIKSKITRADEQKDSHRSISILTIYVEDVLTDRVVCRDEREIRRLQAPPFIYSSRARR